MNKLQSNFIEITLRHGCSPVTLLYISEHLFLRTPVDVIQNSLERVEICSKLTIMIPDRRQWRRSGIFIVNFEHISHPLLVFLLLL